MSALVLDVVIINMIPKLALLLNYLALLRTHILAETRTCGSVIIEKFIFQNKIKFFTSDSEPKA